MGDNASFPPPERYAQCEALWQVPGLIAAGFDLSPARLLSAYAQGLFPWFSEGEPILWWCPDPRAVFASSQWQPSHSLAKLLRQKRYAVSCDHDFAALIHLCARAPRKGQSGTWLTAEMQQAYQRLHALGRAHSVEIWSDRPGGTLIGGLYGVSLGRMFFGESMVSLAPNASKIALSHLLRFCQRTGIEQVDCQFANDHLQSLGVQLMPRADFLAHTARAVLQGEIATEIWRREIPL